MSDSTKPWADMTTAERLDAVLLAVADLSDERYGSATGAAVGYKVNERHPMERIEFSGKGRGKVASIATRVTPALMALRRRKLIGYARRADGQSGSADAPTSQGRARVRNLRGREAQLAR